MVLGQRSAAFVDAHRAGSKRVRVAQQLGAVCTHTQHLTYLLECHRMRVVSTNQTIFPMLKHGTLCFIAPNHAVLELHKVRNVLHIKAYDITDTMPAKDPQGYTPLRTYSVIRKHMEIIELAENTCVDVMTPTAAAVFGLQSEQLDVESIENL